MASAVPDNVATVCNCSVDLTIDLEGIDGLQLSGGRLTQSRKHVHKVVEAEVPTSVLRERLHDSVSERVLLLGQTHTFTK